MILLFVRTQNRARCLPAGRQKHLPGTQVPDLAAMLTGYSVSSAHLYQVTSVYDFFRCCLLNAVTLLSGTHTSLLFITMPWADLLLQTAVSPIRWTHSSLLSAPHISRKISVPFLSPWSVYRLLPGRTWFHCAFNKDSAAPLVTALDLVTGLEWGWRPCSGGHATETQVPMAKLRRTVDPGGSSTHLGQDRKSPESGNRHPTLSELGSNRLHSTFLPAQLQTLKVSEFPKITNFTQPPDRLFMFQKNSRFLNLNSFVNILPRGPRYKSTFHFSSI